MNLSWQNSTFARAGKSYVLLVLMFLMIGETRLKSEDWPGFRGPNGQGVSSENRLPITWAERGPEVEWRTPLPGVGHSSPIVSKGRVIVTSACESREWMVSQTIAIVTTVLLAVMFWLSGRALRVAKARDISATKTNGNLCERLFLGIDSCICPCCSYCFFILAVLVALGPDYIGLAMQPLRQLSHIVGLDGGYVVWKAGNTAAIWLISGNLAALGLACGVTGATPASRWRLLGSALALFTALAVFVLTPPGYGGRAVSLGRKAVFSAVPVSLVLWHILAWLILRENRSLGSHLFRPGFVVCRFLATAVICVAIFVPANLLEPRIAQKRMVIGIDKTNGAVLWETTVFESPLERIHPDNTQATPTACTDGQYIAASFACGLAVLGLSDGSVLWSHEFPDYASNSLYGASSSPVMTPDAVILVQDRERGTDRPSWIAAFDKKTGKVLWKNISVNASEGYGTPVFRDTAQGTELIRATNCAIESYNPDSGALLWRTDTEIGQNSASIAICGDYLCIGGGTSPGTKTTFGLRLKDRGKDTKVETVWRIRGGRHVSSPVIVMNKVMTLTMDGTISCIGLRTGKQLWKARLRGRRFYASLVSGEDCLYACSTEGIVTVIATSDEFKVLAENRLGDSLYATPAISEGRLIIRTTHELFSICVPSPIIPPETE